ncbi:hypothetical protein KHQ88_01160 [Mycoplasmatota bacterium]|nr:hypothetical protein KHQ88_01160 [Mycoplasmatota bacterium]
MSELSMIDIVIYYLNIINEEETRNEAFEVGKDNAKYLLNQTVRQLHLPRNKYYLSEKAKNVWGKIREESDDIFNYWYRTAVEKKLEDEIEVELYKGASKTPYDTKFLKKDDKFIFKDVFHDDHIIPMKLILNKLLNLKSPNRENVIKILEDISVCRMLKSEDRKIKRRHNRPYNESEIIQTIYREQEIVLLNYDYSK